MSEGVANMFVAPANLTFIRAVRRVLGDGATD